FREDLYYRLSIFHMTLPPLRDRRSSIPGLIRTFVKKYGAQSKKEIHGIARSAEAALLNYDYPGNIRQLENIIEHAVALCEGENIVLEDLPEYLVRPAGAAGPQLLYALPKAEEAPAAQDPETLMTLAELEKSYIRKALEVCNRNHTEAARRLGISRSTLWRKLKEHGMEEGAPAASPESAPAR
ncbi:MAG TPA: helix-turn-helix domain-containing protein, partial [Geothrix sp.]|nr:helix-turn-helix domain-containing protein [Geothrix sp.]